MEIAGFWKHGHHQISGRVSICGLLKNKVNGMEWKERAAKKTCGWTKNHDDHDWKELKYSIVSNANALGRWEEVVVEWKFQKWQQNKFEGDWKIFKDRFDCTHTKPES